MALLAGCAFEPEGAVPFDPPHSYRAVFDSAQACSRTRGEFTALHFFEMPGRTFWTPNGVAVGHTVGTDIYLSAEFRDHPMVVKHEMLHALGWHGNEHPAFPFETCHATWDTYRGPSELPAWATRGLGL